MSEYIKSKSMLVCNKPGENRWVFQHSIFLEEVRNFYPVVYHLVLGGIQESDLKGTAASRVKLASAVMCRLQNPKASHCRISTILSSSQLNPHLLRKAKAFCKQALNGSYK